MENRINRPLLLAFVLGWASCAAQAGPIINGVEWYQPADITGYSWNEFNTVCPTGVCTGSINSNDLTGWMWASADDVNALFNYYIGSDELSGGPDFYNEFNSTWAPLFFSDFVPTLTAPFGQQTIGWISTEYDSDSGHAGRLGSQGDFDFAETAFFLDKDFVDPPVGAWLYRSAEVPTPTTFSLLGLGLLMLFRLNPKKA